VPFGQVKEQSKKVRSEVGWPSGKVAMCEGHETVLFDLGLIKHG
jgi:hypothetical protein